MAFGNARSWGWALMLQWDFCHVLSTVPVSAERTHSSRETAYNQELRRHQRAPDALAAALAKRAFVRKTPYRVTTASLPRAADQLAASCGPPFHPLSDAASTGQGLAGLPRAAYSQQEVAAASRQNFDMPASAVSLELACSGQDTVMPSLALSPQQEAGCSVHVTSPKQSSRLREKRLSGRLTSYQRGAEVPRTEVALRASGRAGKPAAEERSSKSSKQGETSATNDRPPCIRSHELSQLAAQFPETCTAGIACIGAEKEQPSAAQQPVQSLAERYADMKHTVMERLTCGTSSSAQDRPFIRLPLLGGCCQPSQCHSLQKRICCLLLNWLARASWLSPLRNIMAT